MRLLPNSAPLALLALLAWSAACSVAARPAGIQAPEAVATAASRETAHGSANLITREMIESAKEPNTYQLVRTLRPDWLRKRGVRGASTAADVVVYLDGSRVGGPDYLRQIPANDVASIRHLSGTEADTRFGRGHEYGAIVVTSR